MKKDWKTKTLGGICKISTGKSNANEAVENGEYAFFDRSKKEKRSTRFLFDCKALIIPGEGAEFFPRYYSGKFDLHQRAYALFNFDESVNIRFVEYYLIFDHKYFERVAVGATAKSLRLRHFQDLLIPLPPLSKQRRIVKILDEAFAAIAKAKENAEKNLQNARDLFESYLQSVFANLSDGWEQKMLGECFKLKSGDNITSRMMNENGKFSVYGGNGIAGMYNKYNLSESNIIIGRVGALCGNVRHITKEIWLTDNAFKITNWKYDFDHAFLTYLLNFKNLRGYARQAAQPVISNSSLENVLLQFPKSLLEQKRIVIELNALSTETKKLEAIYQQKLSDLEELKKSILQKAFNGELKGT